MYNAEIFNIPRFGFLRDLTSEHGSLEMSASHFLIPPFAGFPFGERESVRRSRWFSMLFLIFGDYPRPRKFRNRLF